MKHVLTVLGYMLVSFGVQGVSHFVINQDHYAAVSYARPEPIVPMGLAVMALQGLILSVALSKLAPQGATIRDGLKVSLAFGLFLLGYIAIAEPAKYLVPSIAQWIVVEASAGLLQFTLAGLLIGLIHQKLK